MESWLGEEGAIGTTRYSKRQPMGMTKSNLGHCHRTLLPLPKADELGEFKLLTQHSALLGRSPRGRPYYELFWESKSETDLPFVWNTVIWRNLNWPSRFSLCRNPRLHYSVDPLKYPIQNNPHPVLPLILTQRKSQISHGRFTLPHPRGQFESLSEKVGVSIHWLGFAR